MNTIKIKHILITLCLFLSANIVLLCTEDSTPGESEKTAPVVFDLGKGVKMVFMPIPAGTFMMGSPETEKDRDDDENQVQVALSGFALGQTEVTQAQWKAVMGNNPSRFKGNNPSRFKGDNLPVETVSWDEAMTFCRKLTELARKADSIPEGFKFTLPTEAQWEYACRAGTTTRFSFGNADSSLAQYGNFYDKSGDSEYDAAFRKRVEYPFEPDTSQDDGAVETNRVASYRPNAWGLYDMHGNVWEWCLDYYNPSLSGGKDPVRTAPGSEQYGSLRVGRGGGWGSPAQGCRSALRYCLSPGLRSYDLGFRVALVQSSD